MQVGVNYPWLDYGWDFGLAPAAWRGSLTTPRWDGVIDQHLRRFHDLGIEVVRWFVLADGLTYGTGDTAPKPDPAAGRRWRFEPPPVGADVLDHFGELLRRFASFNAGSQHPIRLLPVLIDFHFCEPGTRCVGVLDPTGPLQGSRDSGWVKRGRADAVSDEVKRRRFLDGALDPLLLVSQQHPDVIHAWELINEPEWVTSGWHPHGRPNRPIDKASMRAFLEEGKDRIRRAGFKSTIGFALIDTLRSSDISADINQFHYYPAGRTRLAPHTPDPGAPAIIGEFATRPGDLWPDLRPGAQSVLHRLRFSAAQGYQMAIPWSFHGCDRHTSWSADVETDLEIFSQEQAACLSTPERP